MRIFLPLFVLVVFLILVGNTMYGIDMVLPRTMDCAKLAAAFDEQFTIPEQSEIKDPCRTQWSFSNYLDIPSFLVGGTLVGMKDLGENTYTIRLKGNKQEGELILIFLPLFALGKYQTGNFYMIDFGNYCKNMYSMVDSSTARTQTKITEPRLLNVHCK